MKLLWLFVFLHPMGVVSLNFLLSPAPPKKKKKSTNLLKFSILHCFDLKVCHVFFLRSPIMHSSPCSIAIYACGSSKNLSSRIHYWPQTIFHLAFIIGLKRSFAKPHPPAWFIWSRKNTLWKPNSSPPSFHPTTFSLELYEY